MTAAHACLLGLWASIWTSPGREDPAWVGGPKVTVLGGGSWPLVLSFLLAPARALSQIMSAESCS